MSEEIITDQNEDTDEIAESKPTDGSLKAEEGEAKDIDSRHIPYDRFKAKVDEANALKEKLAEFENAKAESERKKLEEQNEYKTLYEQALKDAETAKQETVATRKSALLTQAGYNDEQAKLLIKLVDGDDDESIAESIKLLQATVPAQDNYGDPGAFNGAKAKPETVDQEDVGRNAINRVLSKIKL